MDEKPWFEKGLRFECTQCGDCCTGAPGYVWVNGEEIAALAQGQGMSVADFEKKYVRKVGIRKSLIEYANGDCVFFDGKARKCTVYDTRPRQCRTWPFWGSNVATPAAWEQTCQVCPGSGQGKLYSVQHVLHQISVVKLEDRPIVSRAPSVTSTRCRRSNAIEARVDFDQIFRSAVLLKLCRL